jgi:L-ascorbate metabolism protein UlaG (beta-lactamase superfamily)
VTRSLRIDYLGHASLLFELDGVRLLTDPALRERIGPLRRTVAAPARGEPRGVDIALVSHLHWDHLDLPTLRALGRDVQLVVPSGAGDWLRARGFHAVRELAAGEATELGGLTIEAVPAAHSGFRPPVGPTAEALGYVIRGHRSVYFAGDTDLHPAMRSLEGIDVALLPVWGWGPTLGRRGGRGIHLDPVRAARAAKMVGSPIAVPIHWGTYWPSGLRRVRPHRLLQPPREFLQTAAELAPNVRVLATEIGDRVAVR